MLYHYDDLREHFSAEWNLGFYPAFFLVLINSVGQLLGAQLIVGRYPVLLACVLLAAVLDLQLLTFVFLKETVFHYRSVSLFGSLAVLYADGIEGASGFFANVPAWLKSFMLLAGRLQIGLGLYVMPCANNGYLEAIPGIIVSVATIFLIIGLNTEENACVLAIILFLKNVQSNPFWAASSDGSLLQYNFFETISVIGGLLLIISLGPGGASYDAYADRELVAEVSVNPPLPVRTELRSSVPERPNPVVSIYMPS